MTPSWFLAVILIFFFRPLLLVSLSTAKRGRTFEKSHCRRIFLANHHPAENFPPPGIFFPSEESSGRRILRQKMFRPNKKITVVKNYPAKNDPGEEFSSEEFFASGNFCFLLSGRRILRRRILRRRIIRAKNFLAKNYPGKEFSGIERSANQIFVSILILY
jgi:hypothetical protein